MESWGRIRKAIGSTPSRVASPRTRHHGMTRSFGQFVCQRATFSA
jgi:hypothetical protein